MKSTDGTAFSRTRIGTGAIVGFVGALLVAACASSDERQSTPGSSGKAGSGGNGGNGGNGSGGSAMHAGEAGVAGATGGSEGSVPDACVPRSCTATVCGVMQDDGCGTLVECSCPDACVPDTCESQGASCGPLPDGCGETLDCGDCPGTCVCTNGACQGGEEETISSPKSYGRKAESSGFHGTDAQYGELYDTSCFSVDDCVEPCLARGGTEEMCEASDCVDSTSDYCLPATVWSRLGMLSSEGTDVTRDCAELVLWADPYRDYLRVRDFRLEIPETAEILGINVSVRRAGGTANEAVDAGVRLIKNGVMGSADRSTPTPWSGPELAEVEYGGVDDLWNETWSPADVNSEDFGVALSAAYTQTAGNGRAYVDIVYVTVHYRTMCE
jgi:hypothetical protein